MRRLAALLAVLVVLAAIHTAAWLYLTARLESGFGDWVAAERSAGWVVTAGAPERTGWPVSAAVRVPALHMVGGGLAWDSAGVRIALSLLAPTVLTLAADGVQRVQFGPYAGQVTAARLVAAAPLFDHGPTGISGRGVGVTVAGETAVAARLTGTARLGALQIEADQIALPAGYRWALGSIIAAFSFDAKLIGVVPPGESPAAQATAWRNGGGHIEIGAFRLLWGPFETEGQGSAGLDDQLQPQATALLRVQGWDDALDRLVQGRALAARTAQVGRAVLALLGGASPGGVVELPTRLESGVLSLGQIPLVRVPPLRWP